MTHFIEINLNLLNLNSVIKEVAPLIEYGKIIKNDFENVIGYSILINSNTSGLPLKNCDFSPFIYPFPVNLNNFL